MVCFRQTGKHIERIGVHVAINGAVVGTAASAVGERSRESGVAGGFVDAVELQRSCRQVEREVRHEQVACVVLKHVVAREIGALHGAWQRQTADEFAGEGVVAVDVAVGGAAVGRACREIDDVVNHAHTAVGAPCGIVGQIVEIIVDRAHPQVGDSHRFLTVVGGGVFLDFVSRLVAGNLECELARFGIGVDATGFRSGDFPVVGASRQVAFVHGVLHGASRSGEAGGDIDNGVGELRRGRHHQAVAIGSNGGECKGECLGDCGIVFGGLECDLRSGFALRRVECPSQCGGCLVAGLGGGDAPVVSAVVTQLAHVHCCAGGSGGLAQHGLLEGSVGSDFQFI